MIELGIYINRRNKNYPDMTGFSKNFTIGGTGHDQYPDMTTVITVNQGNDKIKIDFSNIIISKVKISDILNKAHSHTANYIK